MREKFNLNTIILLVILLVFIVGVVVVISMVRELTRPFEQAEQVIQEQLDNIINPTPTLIPAPATIIHEMRSLHRLETASYTIEKLITASSGQGAFGFLFGDELILVAYGQVVAGVDLDKLEEDDIIVTDDGTVIVTLPPTEIFSTSLDNDKTEIFHRETAPFGMNPELESAARQLAEEEIENAAIEDGILDYAQENAESYIRQLILSLGFSEVIFAESDATPAPTEAP